MSGGLDDLAVEVTGLTRHFGAVRALDGIDLTIRRGEVFGLLGPNGAGKTTAVRLLNGVLDPTSVQVLRILGRDLASSAEEIRPEVGVQTDTNLYEALNARDNLVLFARLYGLAGRDAQARAGALLERFGLSDRACAKVETFSKGMKQKLLIARALVGDPLLVYLDEPTAGLDPEASHELMTYIRRESRERATTFFITSHRLDEMEDVCTQVAILDGGIIRAIGAPEQVARAAVSRVRVRVTPAVDAVVARSDLLALPGATSAVFDHGGVIVDLVSLDAVPEFVRAAARMPIDLLGVSEQAPTLQEAYLALVGDGAMREVAR